LFCRVRTALLQDTSQWLYRGRLCKCGDSIWSVHESYWTCAVWTWYVSNSKRRSTVAVRAIEKSHW